MTALANRVEPSQRAAPIWQLTVEVPMKARSIFPMLFVTLVSIFLTGCVEPRATICDNGMTCPGGTKCALNQPACLINDCGDGILDVDKGEECDDGNVRNGDGCSSTCLWERCGNGVVDVDEECDDGNTLGGDGCGPNCTIERCGNGILDQGEICDDGNNISGDGCSANCLSTETCGNGVVDIALGERCDDGNNTDGDGCSADCRTNERCGNGVVDGDLGEVCDDGNNVSGDGCSADCLSEETCGNGYLDLSKGEECEPSLPIRGELLSKGFSCGEDCRLKNETSDVPMDPGKAQCRLNVVIDAAPGYFKGRIVSTRGDIDCGANGGECSSTLIDCDREVILVLIQAEEDVEVALSLNWNVPGCFPENRVNGVVGGMSEVLTCSVELSESTPDQTVEITYRDKCGDGSFSCEAGYECVRDASGYSCADIDECTNGTANCGTDRCVNTPGSYRCDVVVVENLTWIDIPAGSFDSSVPAATNPTSVGAFRLSKTPTTVAQFKACVEAGVCLAANYVVYSSENYCNYNRGDAWLNHPMNCVDWTGAKTFCEWIGGRLPTEDEWQYAATHDGTQALQTTYSWGNDAPTHCGHANYDASSSVSNRYCNGKTEVASSVGTSVVGTYSTLGDSPLGLQDMSGNVWEWTSSKYDLSYYVVKGGSWSNDASYLPDSNRDRNNPDGRNNYVGFRCAE